MSTDLSAPSSGSVFLLPSHLRLRNIDSLLSSVGPTERSVTRLLPTCVLGDSRRSLDLFFVLLTFQTSLHTFISQGMSFVSPHCPDSATWQRYLSVIYYLLPIIHRRDGVDIHESFLDRLAEVCFSDELDTLAPILIGLERTLRQYDPTTDLVLPGVNPALKSELVS